MKTRSPLRRKSRLQRSSKPRPKRSKPRRKPHPPNEPYRRWVESLPCLLATDPDPCFGDVHSHHAGEELGANLKPPDEDCVPLCHKHHLYCWHAHAGPFKGWDKARRRDWERLAITLTQERARRAGVLEEDA